MIIKKTSVKYFHGYITIYIFRPINNVFPSYCNSLSQMRSSKYNRKSKKNFHLPYLRQQKVNICFLSGYFFTLFKPNVWFTIT